jgi:hypothetical protein
MSPKTERFLDYATAIAIAAVLTYLALKWFTD